MRLSRLTMWFALIVTVCFGLSFLGRWHFMLDNLSSFRVHFALAFLLCAGVFLATRAYRWLGLTTLGLLVSLVGIIPWYLPGVESAVAGEQGSIRLFASNVSPRLDDPNPLIGLIHEQSPDVVGLIEITPEFLSGLGSVTEDYPYRFEAPADGFWGLALFSKQPLSGARLVRFGDGVPPVIVAELHDGDTVVELILAHPFPPMTSELSGLRNLQLQGIAAHVARATRPTIVMGDLNVALWSPYYRDFVSDAGLTNARRGRGVASTWPPNSLLGVPIDHVLYSDGITAAGFRVLPPFGSDHLPVIADLVIQPVTATVRRGPASGAAAVTSGKRR